MFKQRLQQFFRRLWRAKTANAEAPVVPDLQTRLQHLRERFPEEACLDQPTITMHERELHEVDLKEEFLKQDQSHGLNHWASQKRKTGSGENGTQKKYAFEFEIDPVRAALKISESIEHRSASPKTSNEPRKRNLTPIEQRKVVSPLISEAAVREMTRLESLNKSQILRSLSGLDDMEMKETAHADGWDCLSYNSLFALPDESRYGTTTEYEEDYEEDLLPYFTETLLLQEDEPDEDEHLEAIQCDQSSRTKPSEQKVSCGLDSATNLQPYRNFSENALKLIAQKPETPAPTLKWLASHTNPHIRAAVAKNPSTPGDTITVLAKDHEAGIRHSIAENPLSSMDALNLLIKDRNPLIAWRAQHTVTQLRDAQRTSQRQREAMAQETQESGQYPLREAKIATSEETIAFLQVIARKTNTPARRLDDLARHPDPRIRAAVAENANAPAEILWLLARDADSTVKTKVTDNYNCPIEILEAMKEDEDAYVAYQAHSQLNRVLGSLGDHHIRTATWP